MRVRILTYNVHQCVGSDRHRRVERVAEVIRHHEPDVVCLQEVLWHEADRTTTAQPRRLADLVSLPHGAVGLYRNLKGGAWGNVTLSRFPLHEPETIDLSLRIRLRRTRGALYSRVRLHGRDLHLFNVHLGLAGFERTDQIDRVIARADELAPDGAPAVVVGDTNDWRNRLVRGALARSGFLSPMCDVKNAGPATYPSREPVAALDKLFHRGRIRALRANASRLALAREASDHLPVLVELELTP